MQSWDYISFNYFVNMKNSLKREAPVDNKSLKSNSNCLPPTDKVLNES